nr:putative uncharacterized protein DDB_G0282499 isoform X1 [Onthophagus taurus]
MSKVKKECISDAFAKQYLFNHNNTTDIDDRISISSGNSVLDEDYYINQLSPIPQYVLLNNCIRIDNSKPTPNVIEGKSNVNVNVLNVQNEPSDLKSIPKRSLNTKGNKLNDFEVIGGQRSRRNRSKSIQSSEGVSNEYVRRSESNKIEKQSNLFNKDEKQRDNFVQIGAKENSFNNHQRNFQPPKVVSDEFVQRRGSNKIEKQRSKSLVMNEHQRDNFGSIITINSRENHLNNHERNFQPPTVVSDEFVQRRESNKIEKQQRSKSLNQNEDKRDNLKQIVIKNSRENHINNHQENVQQPKFDSNQDLQRQAYNTFEENRLRSQQRSFQTPRSEDVINTFRSNYSTEINYNRFSNSGSHDINNDDENNGSCCCIIL